MIIAGTRTFIYCQIWNIPKIREYIALMKNKFNTKSEVIRSDWGREYLNHELTKFLKAEVIETQLSMSFSPQKNGNTERNNRLDWNGWWMIQNRLPTRTREKRPHEYFNLRKSNLKDIQIFVVMHIYAMHTCTSLTNGDRSLIRRLKSYISLGTAKSRKRTTYWIKKTIELL